MIYFLPLVPFILESPVFPRLLLVLDTAIGVIFNTSSYFVFFSVSLGGRLSMTVFVELSPASLVSYVALSIIFSVFASSFLESSINLTADFLFFSAVSPYFTFLSARYYLFFLSYSMDRCTSGALAFLLVSPNRLFCWVRLQHPS